MQNGLYKVEFQTPLGQGAGVVMLLDGKLQGGDSGIYYSGTFTASAPKMTAEVTTGRHSTNAPQSVFGTDVVHISLTGSFTGDTGTFDGTAKEAPGLTFKARLERLPV